ncbi:Probable sensor histidine kinase pdtaS [Actinomyces bovis]|uniref:histidine kinase n=1 Tax=Actinomyces bovis TaxID=1658 RepID=A0ABY1VPR8_9ACTO|nr:PAS domain-containing sensor histidine kinase [Actinomyces bovis]SPT53053.1 Probable sensor histidine kinase pdtaS [Actinomyces bovis]VEG53017.1 Probable sensor histidine kinase pdtaS [Actinomyces israelii]
MPIFLPAAVRGAIDLTDEQMDWLHRLFADWQLISDLSVADLVMWVPSRARRFIAIGHCRPSTGGTVHLDDVVGRKLPAARENAVLEALTTGEIQMSAEPFWTGQASVLEEYVPVRMGDEVIAVMTRESSVGVIRAGRLLDESQETLAADLCRMVSQGTFPIAGAGTTLRHGTPRVSDGFLRLDADGRVVTSSPNATSCFRRLGVCGAIEGLVLAEAVTTIIPQRTQVDETLAVVLMGRQAWLTEVEAGGVFLAVRAVPLMTGQQRSGALLLVRDVTELRQREQVLLNKDATIREIHHRVKNNLQTVSALLRMQGRRATNDETREALAEAERRVATIATVHQALSQNVDEKVDFDEVFGQVLRMAASVATPTGQVSTSIEGSFGTVDADTAQALATVLAELVTNAVEHGFGGRDGKVTVKAQRDQDGNLVVHVVDDGDGVQEGRIMSGLGTQIVKTLVRGELRGTIDWQPAAGGGTDVVIHARLRA